MIIIPEQLVICHIEALSDDWQEYSLLYTASAWQGYLKPLTTIGHQNILSYRKTLTKGRFWLLTNDTEQGYVSDGK